MGDSPIRVVEAVILWPDFHGSSEAKRFIAVWFEEGFVPPEPQLNGLERHITSKQDQRFLCGELAVLRSPRRLMLTFELSAKAPKNVEPIANALSAVIKQHLGVSPKRHRARAQQILRIVPKK